MSDMPDDLNSLFGSQPNRPDHADFWRLSEIVLELDGDMDLSLDQAVLDERFDARMADIGVDRNSLTYMAWQRALRVVGVSSSLQLLNPEVQRSVTMASAIWCDAFAIGTYYERRYGGQA